MKNYIGVADWSKWAGKSSVLAEIMKKSNEVSIVLSLDEIRRKAQMTATRENNNKAYQELIRQAKIWIKDWKNVFIDCGLIQEKLEILENTSKELDVPLYKFFLDWPYEVLMDRVRQRDLKDGKVFNEERFDMLYKVLRQKEFTDYIFFDTTEHLPEEIANQIIVYIEQKNK